MKKVILTIVLFFVSCTSALAANWVKFAKEGKTQFYYDRASLQCFKTFDHNSGITTGHEAKVWIKPSQNNDMALWSISCGRKIDKNGSDSPDIYGDDIKPDSLEEKLFNKICPICESGMFVK